MVQVPVLYRKTDFVDRIGLKSTNTMKKTPSYFSMKWKGL